MGVSGLLGFTLFVLIKQPESQLLPLFLCALVLTGAVGSSRLYLNAHTPKEILWGFLVGFSVCFTGMWYWM
nr:phosphatase PAP2 family protein [Arthrospiribacter ruber]